jgi:hypothetical protein
MSYETFLHLYQGPLGQIVYQAGSFLASKEGVLVGKYATFEEAMATLERR